MSEKATQKLTINTPLIEAIARKQCEQHIREVRRWDTDPAKLEAMLPAAIDYSWQDHLPAAQAALTAITEAGYAVVPCNAILAAPGFYATPAISAAQGDG